ncbi:hypothetical protein [Kamptonema sp. PCC 6506]|uniref:hypothetical protein n=1 Tax=Kamptonema sp. PCC 6506 TaxID=272129 RepID=UPI0002EA6842|nr:hypothetical protein [Kamptonema sp. PCC 6506]
MVQYLDGNMGSYLGFAPFGKSDSKPLGYHDCGFSFDVDFWQVNLAFGCTQLSPVLPLRCRHSLDSPDGKITYHFYWLLSRLGNLEISGV